MSAVGLRHLVVTMFPAGMPGLGDYLNRYRVQQYQPRQDAGGWGIMNDTCRGLHWK